MAQHRVLFFAPVNHVDRVDTATDGRGELCEVVSFEDLDTAITFARASWDESGDDRRIVLLPDVDAVDLATYTRAVNAVVDWRVERGLSGPLIWKLERERLKAMGFATPAALVARFGDTGVNDLVRGAQHDLSRVGS
mgnify:CR=1 FL=1